MTDQELKDLVAGLAVKSDRMDAQMAEDRRQILEANLEASREKLKATREQNERSAQLAAQLAEDNRQQKERWAKLDALMAESNRKLEKATALVGGMGQNQGAVAEEFFFNSLQAKPVLGGVQYDDVIDSVRGFSGKLRGEYDVVMVNGKSVALIEVKYVVHPDDIAKTIKGIENYRTFFPQHKNFDVYGAIAGFKVPPEVAEAAKQQGLMVLKRVGDVMEVDAGQPHRF